MNIQWIQKQKRKRGIRPDDPLIHPAALRFIIAFLVSYAFLAIGILSDDHLTTGQIVGLFFSMLPFSAVFGFIAMF